MKDAANVRLTELAHGGGCGCKISPSLLSQILKDANMGVSSDKLLVGAEFSDDAAVYKISDSQALVVTTDFFMPMVDDPSDFGRIAATNAISDVYAMGGTPILALAVLGMPIARLSPAVIRAITQGGAEVCARAGIPIAGGHSIDTLEPIYGLVALGLVNIAQLKTNAGAKAGDLLVLGKPLGVGILSAAFKKKCLTSAEYSAMLKWTTTLNRAGCALAKRQEVHAMTDVTGFGLLGHLLEILRASNADNMGGGVGAAVFFDSIPLLDGALAHAKSGIATGASARNWDSYGASVRIETDNFFMWVRNLLTDPQTSGGLLVVCDPQALPGVLEDFRHHNCPEAAVVGVVTSGSQKTTIEIKSGAASSQLRLSCV